jgi:hypothetical protein
VAEKRNVKRNQRTCKKNFDHLEVEGFVTKAVKKVENKILPLVTALDERDAKQFAQATRLLEKQQTIVENMQVEQSKLKTDTLLLSERQQRIFEDFIPEMRDGLSQIHSTIHDHITDEAGEFDEIRDNLKKAASHVEGIQTTLDNVQANGIKGLSLSLTDIYNKVAELEGITAPARARTKFWKAAHDIMTTSLLLRPLKTWWGAFFYLALLILIVNSVLFPLGLHWNVWSIISDIWHFFGKQS